jgi:hypothetical protein
LKSIDNLKFAERLVVIALTNNAILLTRNESDFGRIVELQIEDWAAVEYLDLIEGNPGSYGLRAIAHLGKAEAGAKPKRLGKLWFW